VRSPVSLLNAKEFSLIAKVRPGKDGDGVIRLRGHRPMMVPGTTPTKADIRAKLARLHTL